jgi:teichuronic acid biosynthesis glycosyltransferase TuaH
MVVVFFTLFRTDSPYSSISLSMARQLCAEGTQVVYINHPYSLKDVWADWRRRDPMLLQRLGHLLTGRNRYETLDSVKGPFMAVQPPVTLPINWLPSGGLYRLLNGINQAIVRRSVRQALRHLKVEDFVYINCYDPFFLGALPPAFGAKMSIYHCIDDIAENPYTARHGERLEHEAIAQADLTLVTSTNLYRMKAPYARRIETFFNAADVANFSRVRSIEFPKPTELEGRTGKVIGFVGNLDELRIDYPLIKAVATAHTDKTLLLIGPVNSPELAQLGIDRFPNVVMAGSRPLHQLPALMQYMDVAIIPFLKNKLTQSIYPLKINEYLAAGKPVVATSFSDDIRSFQHCAYIADDHSAFIRLIDTAIAEDSPEKIAQRTATADKNTWAARIGQLWKLIGL